MKKTGTGSLVILENRIFVMRFHIYNQIFTLITVRIEVGGTNKSKLK
jgi:hypothetical protein